MVGAFRFEFNLKLLAAQKTFAPAEAMPPDKTLDAGFFRTVNTRAPIRSALSYLPHFALCATVTRLVRGATQVALGRWKRSPVSASHR